MQTLASYQDLDRDMILKGVVEWIVMESPLTGVLNFMPMAGNALLYNVETSLPTSNWLAVNDTISEGTGTWEQRTTNIYTLLQNAYTDKSRISQNATQDPEAADIALGAKSMAHEFEKTFIIGRTSVDSNIKQFKGLLRMLAELESASTTDLDGGNNEQVIAVSATSGALTMPYMDELIDQIKPGKPSMLLMSRRARRKLNALSRASGGGLTMTDNNLFGIKMMHYDEIPILVSDWLLDNYADGSSNILDISAYNFDATRTSGTDNTVILALKIGEDSVTALQAGPMTHERETFIEDKNAIANRFTWYVGAAAFKKFGLAALININPDS